jgi:hypothetical protein
MAFCIGCGQKIDSGMTICRYCGMDSRSGRRANGGQEYVPPKPYSWASDSLTGKPAPPPPTRPSPPPAQQYQPPYYQPPAPPVPYINQTPAYGYNYRCPNCGTNAAPRIEEKISQSGWVMFAVLLVLFFPLFWIGLLMKEKYRVCPVCRVQFA